MDVRRARKSENSGNRLYNIVSIKEKDTKLKTAETTEIKNGVHHLASGRTLSCGEGQQDLTLFS